MERAEPGKGTSPGFLCYLTASFLRHPVLQPRCTLTSHNQHELHVDSVSEATCPQSHVQNLIAKKLKTFCLPSLITFPAPAPLCFPLFGGFLSLCFYTQSHDQGYSTSYNLLRQINLTHIHLAMYEQTKRQELSWNIAAL